MNPSLCISADSHVVETPEIFDGLEERFGDAPKIIRHPEYGDILTVPGQPLRPELRRRAPRYRRALCGRP